MNNHFASSEFEITDYEQDNSAALPDNIGLAILMNEIGKLQRHLQLTATTEYSTTRSGKSPWNTIVSIILHTNASAPVDIGAIYRKGKSGKGEGRGKYDKKDQETHATMEKATVATTTTAKAEARTLVQQPPTTRRQMHDVLTRHTVHCAS